MTAVIGPNGAGKSTLLKGIVGVLRPSAGVITGGEHAIAYLPQQAEIDRSFPISVADTVAAGAWKQIGALRALTPELQNTVQAALTTVGLPGFETRPIGSLSSGQFQRVLFARLLVQQAPIIVLDEPFTAVDARTTADLLAVIRGRHHEGATVIAVLHDFEQVRAHFPQTLLLARELIAWGDTERVLTAEHLQRAAGMSERWDDAAPECV